MTYGNLSCPFNSMLSNHLSLEKLCVQDFETLKSLFQDEDVMKLEHTYSDLEIKEWIGSMITRQSIDKVGYLLVRERSSGKCVGVAGPIIIDIDGRPFYGIDCMFKKEYWGTGYAQEALGGIIFLLLQAYGAQQVIASIRPENTHAIALAERLGMQLSGSHLRYKNYIESKFNIYKIEKKDLI